MLDWYPINNSGFRLSAGVSYNDNKVTRLTKATKSTTFNGTSYSPDQTRTIKFTLGNKIAPIVTLGYDSSILNETSWSFNCEAGIMFGNIKIDARTTGAVTDKVKAYIKKDAATIEKDLRKKYPFYPIISLGFKYNF